MNIEGIVSQPAIMVPPDSWLVPTDEDTPEFEAAIEQTWPRIFPRSVGLAGRFRPPLRLCIGQPA